MTTALALPIMHLDAPPAQPATRGACTDCGVSRTQWAARCESSCQFVEPRYEALERRAHGRSRDAGRGDELHFGPYVRIVHAALRRPRQGDRSATIVARLVDLLLADEMVDAVIGTVRRDDGSRTHGPVLITDPKALESGRIVSAGFSPVLAMIERAVALGHRRLALVGVPCQVHALRALERELGLDRLYIIGTPCSANTTPEGFHALVQHLGDRSHEVEHLELTPDQQVDVLYRDGSRASVSAAHFPAAVLADGPSAAACRTCFDYTGALADITIGHMGARTGEWLIVRNARGLELLALLSDELVFEPATSRGNRRSSVRAFVAALRKPAAPVASRWSPGWATPLVGWMRATFGTRGLELARTRVEMKAAAGIMALGRDRQPHAVRGVPAFAWTLVAPYGITPSAGQLETERAE